MLYRVFNLTDIILDIGEMKKVKFLLFIYCQQEESYTGRSMHRAASNSICLYKQITIYSFCIYIYIKWVCTDTQANEDERD